MLARFVIIALAAASTPAFAWTESAEFPWNTFPRHLWERELVWMKNVGIRHVSLPSGTDAAQLREVISLIRRVGIEADLEGEIPTSYEALSTRHGGPLTDAAPGARRISVLQSDALFKSRQLLLEGAAGIIWTNIEDTLGPDGYVPGAVTFAGQERAATSVLRRSAQLSRFWNTVLAGMRELPGAATRLPAEAIVVKQYASANGVSLVAIMNSSPKSWTGDIRATYPAMHRTIVMPSVTVPGRDVAWLPVGIPLTASPLCRDCTGFAPTDHLVYSTAELTAMEYENGILALEFSSAGAAEVILQLSRQPSGPLVAGGKPAAFDWDDKALRTRLPVPAGASATHRVRIGLAMEAPDSTGFFDGARVLLTGETNRLKAEFSSEAIAQRSGLRIAPSFTHRQAAGKQPLEVTYDVDVPADAMHGDHAEIALEADGSRLSHAQPQLLRPATVRLPDAVGVRLAANSTLALSPAVIPFVQRTGREFTVSLRNNAAEIRTFRISIASDNLEFSPPQTLTIGASASRDLTFRLFPTRSASGLHIAEVRVTGAAQLIEPIRFLAIPQSGTLAWSAEGFSFLESAKTRASFFRGRWLEYLNKESGTDAMTPGGILFDRAVPAAITDLESFLPKSKH